MLHITPWTLILMLHIRQSIYLVLTNVSLLHFWWSTLHSMKFHYNSKVQISLLHIYRAHLYLPELYRQCCADLNQHNTVCIILVKIDVLNTCWTMTCSYFGIAFVLLFKIENAVYTCFQNCMLLFINWFIFDIMNIQNNQSLEFEWAPMLVPFIRSVNDWRFPWLRNVFIKSFQDWMNSVQQCQGNFTKDAGQKMFISISWQTYEGLTTSVNY